MKVAYTRRARQLIERIGRWWVTNREAAPDLFFAELDAAIELLETSPEVGSPYRTKQGDVVRRILLQPASRTAHRRRRACQNTLTSPGRRGLTPRNRGGRTTPGWRTAPSNARPPVAVSAAMCDQAARGSREVPWVRTVGEILLSEFLWAEKNYAEALAECTGLPLSTTEAILHDEVHIDDGIAARLADAFMTDPRFWIDLQIGGTPTSSETRLGPCEGVRPIQRRMP